MRTFGPARRIEAVAADASVREFFRLHLDGSESAIAMVDSEGGRQALDRMEAAHDLLRDIQVPIAGIRKRSHELDAVLLEDLGDTLLADVVINMSDDLLAETYAHAARLAARISRLGTPLVTPGHMLAARQLGRERLRVELAFFAVHDVANRRGVKDRELLTEVGELLDRIADELADHPRQLAHRDYHARNLMLTSPGPLGIVDYQDALLAPMYYDLVSLIYDPYVDKLDEGVRKAAAAAYREEAQGAIDPLEDPRLPWVGLQRLLKALGTYSFQSTQRGKTAFDAAIPLAEKRAVELADMIPDAFARQAVSLLSKLGFAS